ncbi:MAG: MmcQ/YjbR family DNA-binding protein [Firmicutes bacterium]|nr:MmcQ/YjbR family DNA-binding protein [Bacillota bacterium]
MSIESDFFKRHRPAFAKMEEAGFQKTEAGFEYEEVFYNGQFRAQLSVDEAGEVRGKVFDLDTEEEYLPIRAIHQTGSFVGSVREAYFQVLARLRDECFVPVDYMYDQSNRISARIEQTYGDQPEFPWDKYPGNGVYKCKGNGKWYAAILTVARGKLEADHAKAGAGSPLRRASGKQTGPDPEQIVEVINLKTDPEEIPYLTGLAGIFPAWHMNKKHWISVILDGTLSEGQIMNLVKESYRLVAGKKSSGHVTGHSWIIPSNPKIYDVDAGFAAGGGTIEWHQHNNIKAGDTLFIYSAAPNSAILYRCEVEEADLGYQGMFKESKGYTRSMRIRLTDRYSKDQFPLSFMKANGGSAIRGARRMPDQLLKAMERKLQEES